MDGKLHDYYESKHVKSSEAVKDFVIGMSDGLTVPFALVAGLSGVINSSSIIVMAGLAEISAGMIAMGLGGYLAARTQREHYESELKREEEEIIKLPEREAKEVEDILSDFGMDPKYTASVIEAFKQNPQKWRDFMMRFELGLEKPDPSREKISPLVIGSAYGLGGIIPLSPYLFIRDVDQALIVSCIVTFIALIVFGGFKGRYTGVSKIKSALQTCSIGSLAASVAFIAVKIFS